MRNDIHSACQMTYLKAFSCIAGACEDTCCVGWDVEIDRKTYSKYQKLKDPILSPLIKQSVFEYPHSFDPQVDYARVKLKKNKRCPFLDAQKLCVIQRSQGEGSLSNVCATYPRMTNLIDGILETTLTLSCPVAARLVLKSDPHELSFVDSKIPERYIINLAVDTCSNAYAKHPVRHLHLFRKDLLQLLELENYTLFEKLTLMGYYFESVQKYASNKQVQLISDFSKQFFKSLLSTSKSDLVKNYLPTPLSAPYLVSEIIKLLNVSEEIDSKKFVHHTDVLARRIFTQEKKVSPTHYEATRATFTEPYRAALERMLTRYTRNYIFKNLFPFTESENLFEAYAMLVVRVMTLSVYSLSLNPGSPEQYEDDFIRLVQCYAKSLEHHKHFTEPTLKWLRRKQYLHMDFIAPLLLS